MNRLSIYVSYFIFNSFTAVKLTSQLLRHFHLHYIFQAVLSVFCSECDAVLVSDHPQAEVSTPREKHFYSTMQTWTTRIIRHLRFKQHIYIYTFIWQSDRFYFDFNNLKKEQVTLFSDINNAWYNCVLMYINKQSSSTMWKCYSAAMAKCFKMCRHLLQLLSLFCASKLSVHMIL